MVSPHKNRHPRKDQDLRSDATKLAAKSHVCRVCPPDNVVAGIKTLLASYSADARANRHLTREENTNIAAVRVWLMQP